MTLTQLADGAWVDTEPVRIVGMPLTSTMTVLRLGDGTLLLHSPVRLTPERRAAVQALGPVAHLYAPNTYHHLWIGEWSAAFPDAQLHAPAELRAKRPELRIDRTYDQGSELVDEVRVEGFRLQEVVVHHEASRTLVIADLAHNIGRPDHAWTKLYAGAMGFYGQVALSRMLRWVAFTDRAAARRSVDAILERPFERIVFGHGAPLERDAHDALGAACAWLGAAQE